jgi:hypothetical protein
MTTFKTVNTERINAGGIDIVIKTIEKTIHLTKPFVKRFFEMTINGNEVGSFEMMTHQKNWYLKNYKFYV